MRSVILGLRWIALPTAAFFLFALVTGIGTEAATAALVIVGIAVIVATIADLAVRRR